MVLRRLLLPAALAALAWPAAAAHARTFPCASRAHEHTVAHDARAAVLTRPILADGFVAGHWLIGCSRRTGQRNALVRLDEEDVYGGDALSGLKLRGTRVAYVVDTSDREDDYQTLYADDVVHPSDTPVELDAPRFTDRWSDPLGWTLDAEGAVAWVVGNDTLMAWTARDGVRLVDQGLAIGHPTLSGLTVRYRHDGRTVRASLAHRPDACAGATDQGTPELDLALYDGAAASTLAVCRRATGTVLRLPVATADGQRGPIATGGPFAAMALDGAIVRFDTVAGTAETIAAPDAGQVVVDEHGSLAWPASPAGADGPQLWVRDALGTRTVATGDPHAAVPLLRRDGTSVAWGIATATLVDP